MRKQPTTALPLTLLHAARGLGGLLDRDAVARFERAFAGYIGCSHAIAVGSGTTALYLCLAALSRMKSGRDEVMLPAYSVPTLIHAVRLAGLRPVYCDVAPETFNMDPASMYSAVTKRTLAIVPFHMFGFPCTLDRALKLGRERGIFIIEDACQALGATLAGKRVGSIGDAGFFSLCKGKIISTFRGGVVTTNDQCVAENIRELSLLLPPADARFRFFQPFIMAAFSLSMRPWFYGAFYPLIARFKSTTLHESFHPARFTRYSAASACEQLRLLDRWIETRRRNGLTVMEGLTGDDGLALPRIIGGAEPSFNHIPIVFRDRSRMEETEKRLREAGIDTARMYERPVHRCYPELGYPLDPESFPGAAYIAPRLLTLPAHPYLTDRDVARMVETVLSTK
jgi:dTDP-4-amino-4,6-dideoxygalactose transaminase